MMTYDGDPTATQAPGLRPLPGTRPRVSLPADADGGTTANLWQAFRENSDYIAYLNAPGRRRVLVQNIDALSFAAPITTNGPLTNLPELSSLVVGGGASAVLPIEIGAPGFVPTYGSPMWRMYSVPGSGDGAAIYGTHKIWQPQCDFMQICFEQDVIVDSIAANSGSASFGLCSEVATALAPGSESIYLSHSGSGLWILNTSIGNWSIGGTTPTPNVAQRFRLMIYGAATPRGVAAGGALIEIWLNDVLAQTIVNPLTTAPPTRGFFPFQAANTNATDVLNNKWFGPWTISLNKWA